MGCERSFQNGASDLDERMKEVLCVPPVYTHTHTLLNISLRKDNQFGVDTTILLDY